MNGPQGEAIYFVHYALRATDCCWWTNPLYRSCYCPVVACGAPWLTHLRASWPLPPPPSPNSLPKSPISVFATVRWTAVAAITPSRSPRRRRLCTGRCAPCNDCCLAAVLRVFRASEYWWRIRLEPESLHLAEQGQRQSKAIGPILCIC